MSIRNRSDGDLHPALDWVSEIYIWHLKEEFRGGGKFTWIHPYVLARQEGNSYDSFYIRCHPAIMCPMTDFHFSFIVMNIFSFLYSSIQKMRIACISFLCLLKLYHRWPWMTLSWLVRVCIVHSASERNTWNLPSRGFPSPRLSTYARLKENSGNLKIKSFQVILYIHNNHLTFSFSIGHI